MSDFVLACIASRPNAMQTFSNVRQDVAALAVVGVAVGAAIRFNDDDGNDGGGAAIASHLFARIASGMLLFRNAVRRFRTG